MIDCPTNRRVLLFAGGIWQTGRYRTNRKIEPDFKKEFPDTFFSDAGRALKATAWLELPEIPNGN